MEPLKILIAEDDGVIGEDLSLQLSTMGYAVTGIASTAEEVVRHVEITRPDVVLMDIRLEGKGDGIQAAQEIRRFFDVPSIFLTAFADKKTLERAKSTRPIGYIQKPFTASGIRAAIEVGMCSYQTEHAIEKRERCVDDMFRCASVAMIAMDAYGDVTLMNPLAEGLTGWKQDEAVGTRIAEVFNIPHRGKSISAEPSIFYALQGHEVIDWKEHETKLIRKDGATELIDYSAAPILDDNQECIGAVSLFYSLSAETQSVAMKEELMGTDVYAIVQRHRRDAYEIGLRKAIAKLFETRHSFRSKTLERGHIVSRGGSRD